MSLRVGEWECWRRGLGRAFCDLPQRVGEGCGRGVCEAGILKAWTHVLVSPSEPQLPHLENDPNDYNTSLKKR